MLLGHCEIEHGCSNQKNSRNCKSANRNYKNYDELQKLIANLYQS